MNTLHTRHVSSVTTIGGGYGASPSPIDPQNGSVWFDGVSRSFKVYTNSGWQDLYLTTQVDIDPDAAEAVDWAIKQVSRPGRLAELVDKYPMVAEALEELATVIKLHENLDSGQPK